MKHPIGFCIWCLKQSHDKDVEHIFPEALGCPSFFTLPGSVVCKKCNNALAPLDRAVTDEFDFILFTNGIKRKNNRKPEISSRGNVIAKHKNNGPEFYINAESHTITLEDGTHLTPHRPNTRSIKTDIIKYNDTAKISMTFAFGQGKKFVRGITKIAINSLAYASSPSLILSKKFDSIKNYVKYGGAKRKILVFVAQDNDFKLAIESISVTAHEDYIIAIRIANVHFLVDLSPSNSAIEYLAEAASKIHGKEGWTTIPN